MTRTERLTRLHPLLIVERISYKLAVATARRSRGVFRERVRAIAEAVLAETGR